MTRKIRRRIERIETRRREREFISLSDAELDARFARTANDLLQAHLAHELQQMFTNAPVALAVLGLTDKEPAHALN